jgi:hypothetical protein
MWILMILTKEINDHEVNELQVTQEKDNDNAG